MTRSVTYQAQANAELLPYRVDLARVDFRSLPQRLETLAARGVTVEAPPVTGWQ